MSDCNPVATPVVEKVFEGLRGEKVKTAIDVELYQQMIGSLLYIALRSRPDILVAVSILSRFQQKPTQLLPSVCQANLKISEKVQLMSDSYIKVGTARFLVLWMQISRRTILTESRLRVSSLV